MAQVKTPRILKDLSQADLLAEIQRLRDENEALAASGGKAEGVSIVEKYNKPFLEFKGNFTPFSFSVMKCERIVRHFDAIQAFAKSQGKKI